MHHPRLGVEDHHAAGLRHAAAQINILNMQEIAFIEPAKAQKILARDSHRGPGHHRRRARPVRQWLPLAMDIAELGVQRFQTIQAGIAVKAESGVSMPRRAPRCSVPSVFNRRAPTSQG